MPAARAICARRVMDSSTLLVSTIIRSANSSMMMTMKGSGLCSEFSVSSNSESDCPFSNVRLYCSMLRTLRCASSFSRDSISRVAFRKTFDATLQDPVTTGAGKCGISS